MKIVAVTAIDVEWGYGRWRGWQPLSLNIKINLYWHYVTNRQVAGSIPDGVIGIFQ